MSTEDKISIEIFKVVTRAIAKSDNMEIMTQQMAHLLVGALEIKGCTLFVLNPGTDELESVASSGLSMEYMHKGPVFSEKGIVCSKDGEAVIVADVSQSDLLQYPEEAIREGIAAIISVPIIFLDRFIGCLRLYHHEIWHISEGDIDSLKLLGENVGLGLVYNRVLNALQAVKYTVDDIHAIWLPKE